MEKGLVSIITPVYNGGKFISQTIDSVLAQTYPHWEMIVIDDGSIDNSTAIISDYIKKDSRIQIHYQKNGGSAAARNNGIRRANGQYICLLDADDTWDTQFLDKQLNFMKVKNAHLVYSSHTRINENSEQILKPFIVPATVTYHELLKTCSISCLTGMYDTEPFGKVYLKEEFKSLRDDFIYWLEIIKKVKIAYGNQEILANYRILSNSATRRKKKLIIPQFKVLHEVEKLNYLQSVYYLATWAVYGFLKYNKKEKTN